MARRGKINWILLIVVLVGLAALTTTFVGLRTWNRTHRSKVGLERGTEAYENQDWKDAASYLGQYLAVNPQDVAVLLQYAEAQLNLRPMKRSNVEQAIRAYNQILRIEDNREAAALLTEIYLQSGDYVESAALAEDFLGRQYDSRISLLLSETYIRQKKFKEAAAVALKIIEEDSYFLEAYQVMGRLAEEDAKLTDKSPRQWFDEGVRANPNHPRAYLYRAGYLNRIGETQQVQEDLLKAEALTFEDVEDRFRLVSMYLRLDEPDKAAAQIEIARQEDPTNQVVWRLWSQWAMETGDPDEMVRIARQGLETLKPNHFDFLSQAAELFIRAAAYDEAQDCISQLQKLQPDASSVLLLEGLLAESRQQWTQAVQAWRKLSTSSQKNEMVLSRLAYALEMMGDPIAAIQEYRNLILLNPDHAGACQQLSRLLSDQGRLSEALEYARRAASLLPDDTAAQNQYRRLQFISAMGSDSQQWRQWDEEIAQITDDRQRHQMQLMVIQNKISNRMLEEAAGDFSRLKQEAGPTLQVRLLEAELLKAQQKTTEAEAVLKIVVQEHPESMEALASIVSLYTESDNLDAAVKVLGEALPRFTDPQDQKRLTFWLAETEYLMGSTDQAVERLKALATQDPTDIMIYRQLLKISRKTAPVNELQGWIDRIREIEGTAGRQYRFEQAYLWYERGDFQKEYPRIVELLGETLRDYPEDQSSRVLLAASHQKIGNLRLAVSTYREALDRDPYNLDLIAAAVGLMYQVEDYRQAEEILARTASMGINDSRLSQLQLQRLLKEGKYSPAGDILENMLVQSPENTDVKLSLALIRLYNNQIPAAEQLINDILRQDPRFLPAIAAKVEIRLKQGKPDEALDICNRAVDDLNSPRALTLRALTYAKIGQAKKAAEDIDQMIASFESTAENLILASDLYHYLGQIDRAQQLARQAMEKAPEDFPIIKKTAFLSSLTPGKQPQARELMKQALAINPEDAQMLLLKANFLIQEATEASIQEAMDTLNNLLFQYPRLEAAWVTLADWTLRQGQTGKAMDQILQGLGYLPNSKSLLMLKARLESERSINLALPTLEFLYELDPKDGRIVAQLARVYLELDQTRKAVELLEQSRRQSDISQADLLDQLLTNALYQAGRKEQAGQLFEEKMQEEAARPGILVQWAQTLIQDRQWDALTAMLQTNVDKYPELIPYVSEVCLQISMEQEAKAKTKAHELLGFLEAKNPQSEQVNLLAARVHHFGGDIEQAIGYYEKVLALNPDQVTAMNNLAWILCTEKDDAQRALKLANHGLQVNPQNIDLLDTRGEIYYRLGMYEQSVTDFRKAVQLYDFGSPQKTKSCYRLVQALIKEGQTERAKEQIRYALQLNEASKALTIDQQQELDLLSKQLSSR